VSPANLRYNKQSEAADVLAIVAVFILLGLNIKVAWAKSKAAIQRYNSVWCLIVLLIRRLSVNHQTGALVTHIRAP
jgi:hypothetical protein